MPSDPTMNANNFFAACRFLLGQMHDYLLHPYHLDDALVYAVLGALFVPMALWAWQRFGGRS